MLSELINTIQGGYKLINPLKLEAKFGDDF